MVRRKSNGRSRNYSTGAAKMHRRGHVLIPNRTTSRAIRVLKEIRYLRRSVSLLIPQQAFIRVVRSILTYLSYDVVRIQATALQALQEAAEAYLVQFFEDCAIMSMHANRVTINVQDFRLVRYFRGRMDVANA